MAISREGIIVSSVSGALGPAVFYQGARAGVIGTRPHGSKTQSEDQRKRRSALLLYQAFWRENFGNYQTAWIEYAKTLPWTNRLGIRRGISGYNAYLAYAFKIAPYGEGIHVFWHPPLGITTPSPTILAASFEASGPCTITTTENYPPYTSERLTIQNNLKYGPRTSTGSTKFAGIMLRDATTIDWSVEINERAIDLAPGDIIKIRIYWITTANWPSQNAEWTTTVS
jgi:hypothetical protein